MAKMAQGGFSCAPIEETQQLIKITRSKVRKENKGPVEFLGHQMVKAALESHPTMVYKIKQTAAFHATMAQQRIHRHD
jgi:hypothetical protein